MYENINVNKYKMKNTVNTALSNEFEDLKN